MGSVTYYDSSDWTKLEVVQRELRSPEHRIVDCSIRGSQAYVALEHAGEVFAAIVSMHRDHGNWNVRTDTDSCGPYHFDCPLKILDQLTPTENQTANEWRAECRRQHEIRREIRPLKQGDWIRTKTPIKFTSGDELDTFEVRYYKKRRRRVRYFRSIEGGAYRFALSGQEYTYIDDPRKPVSQAKNEPSLESAEA